MSFSLFCFRNVAKMLASLQRSQADQFACKHLQILRVAGYSKDSVFHTYTRKLIFRLPKSHTFCAMTTGGSMLAVYKRQMYFIQRQSQPKPIVGGIKLKALNDISVLLERNLHKQHKAGLLPF